MSVTRAKHKLLVVGNSRALHKYAPVQGLINACKLVQLERSLVSALTNKYKMVVSWKCSCRIDNYVLYLCIFHLFFVSNYSIIILHFIRKKIIYFSSLLFNFERVFRFVLLGCVFLVPWVGITAFLSDANVKLHMFNSLFKQGHTTRTRTSIISLTNIYFESTPCI